MKKNTAFYIEILALLLVLIFGTTVVVQIFGYARKMSIDAAQIANAVPLAHNAAEAFTAGEDMTQYPLYFDADGKECKKEDGYYYSVLCKMDEEPKNNGVMKHAVITVALAKNAQEVVYELEAQKYVPQGQ